jgi:orotate phosphoribosyltransferase
MYQTEITEVLAECKVVTKGHFVGTSGKHLADYFDKNRLFRNPVALERLCEELAARCLSSGLIQVVIAPAIGGAFVGQRLAYYLSRLQGISVDFIFTEKKDGIWQLRRGQTQGLVYGANAVGVEDVITSGLSMREGAIEVASSVGLNMIAGATLCKRGKTPEEVGMNGPIHALLDIAWPSWAATEEDPCPLCRDQVAFNTDVGHAKDYLEELTSQGRLLPWMTGNQSIDAGRTYDSLPG